MNNPGMMKQLLQMQKQLKQTQKELEKEIVIGRDKDGMVEIMLTGTQQYHGVKVDKDMLQNVSAIELEKSIGAAVKDALSKTKKLMADKLGPLGGGMPGLKP
jgi:DNA-binding YbaB/EbfC family protein